VNVVILAPRRPDGGVRDRLWEFCRSWWTERFDWPITESHHLDGMFNRSAAISQAAAEAGPWDVAVIIDADVVADETQVAAAVEAAHTTGRMTLAYDRYVSMGQAMTAKALDGYDGDWTPGALLKMTSHVSSIVVVPWDLFDRVGGFDERFDGWGHEDVAFAQSCRVLGGGVDRIPGSVWHLYHGPLRRSDSAQRGSAQLYARYAQTEAPAAMERLVAERTDPDGVVAVMTTHGRRECIEKAIGSLNENLKGLTLQRRVISDDSGDPEYHAWLRLHFPDWELTGPPRAPVGFAGNVAHAWDTALGSGQRFVFWAEDDFTYNRPVDLSAMADVLDANPHLAQMALRRQAWFPAEIKAGGIIEQDPDAYVDCCDGPHEWLEHRKFWTTNPSLIPRSTFVEHPWPTRSHSEALFARKALIGDTRSGWWGSRVDDPWIEHFGERTGKGY
jgi:GT2 family glycosyltransferase